MRKHTIPFTTTREKPEHEFAAGVLWIRTCDNRVRGIFVSSSRFSDTGTRMIHMNCKNAKVVKIEDHDCSAEYQTVFGVVTCAIGSDGITVTYPDEIAPKNEYPAER